MAQVKKKLKAIIVNPSTPIGKGDIKPTPTGKIILDVLNRDMPAYVDTGLNFVHVDDVHVRLVVIDDLMIFNTIFVNFDVISVGIEVFSFLTQTIFLANGVVVLLLEHCAVAL